MITAEVVDTMTVAEDQSVSDVEIVSRVLGGDLESFEVLMRRYNQRLFRVTRSMVRTDQDAEDIVQETYLQAYRHLADFEGRAKFSTWLTKIAIHAALAHRRRSQRLAPLVPLADDNGGLESRLASSARDPEHEVSNDELGRILEGAVDSLPQNYRSVFVLRAIEGMDTADTAEHLAIGLEAVKTRLHRARSLLKQRLQTRLGEATTLAFRFLGARCDRMVEAVLHRLHNERAVAASGSAYSIRRQE